MLPVSQQKKEAEKQARLMKMLNLISFRLPLINPDKFLERLLPYLSWFLGTPLNIAWLLLCSSGCYQVFTHWDRLVYDSAGIFYADNWFWLACIYLLLKLCHELFHGLISKRYGGQIYEAGVILILFIPIGYVDATSSWRFNSRWQRFQVAIAGMFIELFLAAIAVWIWINTEAGIIHDLAFNAIIIASISTLFFNANPLMKFDGYFALSDLLDIPNLYTKGRQYLFYLARRYLLGMKVGNVLQRNWRDYFIRVYGVLAFIWRMMIVVILTTAAWHLFHGLGILIALLSIIAMFGIPGYRLLKCLIEQASTTGISFVRMLLRMTVLAGLSVFFLTQVNWSWPVYAPAIVDYSDLDVIRARTQGIVKQIYVSENQQVYSGDLLLSLDNYPLRNEAEQLELQIEQSMIKSRILYRQGAISAHQAELKETNSLKKELVDKQKVIRDLEIRSPKNGIVIGRDLTSLIDTYIKVGDELLIVADGSDKELKISIAQEHAVLFRSKESRIKGQLNGTVVSGLDAKVTRIEPRASKNILYPALSATVAGDLEVKINPEGNYELLKPRFDVRATIAADVARQLYAGSVLMVSIDGQKRTLWNFLNSATNKWIRHLAKQASS